MSNTKEKNCKNCDKECSCRKYQEKALELEVDEELRQDRLREFWQRYRFIIYGGICLTLAITAGAEIYRSWWLKVRLAESDIFEQGVVAAYGNKVDEAATHFKQLIDAGKTSYRYLAQMELAGLNMRNNKLDEALTGLQNIMNSNAPQELRYIATLSYVGHQFDKQDSAVSLAQLQPLLDDPAFMGVATQMVCALYIKNGQNDKAKDLITKALAVQDLKPNVRTKLEALQSMIESK